MTSTMTFLLESLNDPTCISIRTVDEVSGGEEDPKGEPKKGLFGPVLWPNLARDFACKSWMFYGFHILFTLEKGDKMYPIGSMYGIFTYIYHKIT